jgi:hypothetical protein
MRRLNAGHALRAYSKLRWAAQSVRSASRQPTRWFNPASSAPQTPTGSPQLSVGRGCENERVSNTDDKPSDVRIRRAPKFPTFLILGGGVGAIVSFVLTALFPVDPSVGFGALFGYFALYGVTGGVLVGALIAIILDRRSLKHVSTASVVVETTVRPDGPFGDQVPRAESYAADDDSATDRDAASASNGASASDAAPGRRAASASDGVPGSTAAPASNASRTAPRTGDPSDENGNPGSTQTPR